MKNRLFRVLCVLLVVPIVFASSVSAAPSAQSDTKGNFTVPQGKTYMFKITSSSKPSLAAGSKSFQYVSTVQSGHDYFIKFSAIGKAGDGCGFYLNGGKLPVAIATINSTSANGIVYTNSEVGFSLTLPASWAEQYSVIPSATSVAFLHKESAEQTGREIGVLFNIIRYDGKLATVVGAGERYLVAQTNKYSYVLAYPSGVEYTDSSKVGYQKLAADIDKIGKTVTTVPVTDISYPTYSAFTDSDENGLTDNHIYTFANGSVNAAPGDCLLMLNGEFSDADVIIRNNCALVPVNTILQACGEDVLVLWGYQADNGGIFPYGSDSGSSNLPLIIKIYKADGSIDIKMTVGQTTADVNGKTEALDTPPVIENNTAYVPLRFVCDCFGKSTGYLPAGPDVSGPNAPKGLAFNPIVWVDDFEKTNAAKPTDATLTWLKAQMNQALTSLKNHLGTVLKGTSPNDPSFSQIAHDINTTYYVGNVGRYALYQGPYITLVDVNTKTIYFYTLHPDTGYIRKANMSDPETFILHYFGE